MLDPTLAATEGLDVTMLDASTVRPFDCPGVARAFGPGAVVLVEPSLAGTSAADIARALVDVPHRLLAVGVPRIEHRRYGTVADHDAAHGLDASGLRHQIERFVSAA